ncbi:uncharacterized protein [Amphiura filiformis]|uniref:uncharacterized protein isoform X1 n=1 Tax=Amphiura filiformis TaxID=82378 RepID=UPI003B2133F3
MNLHTFEHKIDKMGIFENCCCFFDLQVGAALSAVYSSVTSCVPFVFALLSFISLQLNSDVYASGYLLLNQYLFEPVLTVGDSMFSSIRIILAVIMSIWGLHIFSSILLLIAAWKNDRYKMIPYMLFTGLIVLIHLGGTSAIIYMLLAMRVPYVAVGPFTGLTLSLANGILNLYCLLVVASRYQDLRDASNTKCECKQNGTTVRSDKPITKAEENDYV